MVSVSKLVSGGGSMLLLAALIAVAPTGPEPVQLRPVASTAEVVRVGTFNVRSVRHDLAPEPAEEPWRVRRTAVVRDILAEGLDVVGLQEASQNPRYAELMDDGPTQYQDLVAGLNESGGTYAVTDADVRTSRDTRIVYDTSALDLVRTGAYEYAHQSGGANDQRFLVWADFRVRANGSRFFFATTHLVNKSEYLQKAQWRELLAQVERLRDGLPVVVGGDFQSSKKSGTPASTMMTVMRKAGFNDVLNQRPATPWLTNPRPDTRRHAWINSANHFDRNVRDYAYEKRRGYAGNSIDWIFASNQLAVRRYRVVVRFDRETLRLRGVIPSDHFLVTARIVIP